MAHCPVEDCGHQVSRRRKRVAQHCADLAPLIEMLERLYELLDRRLIPDDSPLYADPGVNGGVIYRCAATATSYFNEMHAAAHGERSRVPGLSELNACRDRAQALTLNLTKYDTEWYLDFWRRKFASGVKPPPGLAADLRRAGVGGV